METAMEHHSIPRDAPVGGVGVLRDTHRSGDGRDDPLLRLYFGPIMDFLDGDGEWDAVSEVMINRHDDIWIERRGKMERTGIALDPQMLENAIVKMTNMSGDMGGTGALLNVHWSGLRVAATLHPTSHLGNSLSIRRKVQTIVRLEDYARGADFTETDDIPDPSGQEDLLRWLQEIVVKRKTILVSGGTSSGKTTFLNALLATVPKEERILTIEDNPELEPQGPNVVRFLASEILDITATKLLKQALRYRPDRIIVGEVRGGEALDMLDACNTGHDGSLTSIHANSPWQALGRLETLVLKSGVNWPHAAIRQTIAETIDYVIQMRRRSDGGRGISDIMALGGMNLDGTYRVRNIRVGKEK